MIPSQKFFDILKNQNIIQKTETGATSLQNNFLNKYFLGPLWIAPNGNIGLSHKRALSTQVVLFDHENIGSFKDGNTVFLAWGDIKLFFDRELSGSEAAQIFIKRHLERWLICEVINELPEKNAGDTLGLSSDFMRIVRIKEGNAEERLKALIKNTSWRREGIFDEAVFLKTSEGAVFWSNLVTKGVWTTTDIDYIKKALQGSEHDAEGKFLLAFDSEIFSNTAVSIKQKTDFLDFFKPHLPKSLVSDLIKSLSVFYGPVQGGNRSSDESVISQFYYASQSDDMSFLNAMEASLYDFKDKNHEKIMHAARDILEKELTKNDLKTGKSLAQAIFLAPDKVISLLNIKIKNVFDPQFMKELLPWVTSSPLSWEKQKEVLFKIKNTFDPLEFFANCHEIFSVFTSNASHDLTREGVNDFLKTFVWDPAETRDLRGYVFQNLVSVNRQNNIIPVLEFLKEETIQKNELNPEWFDLIHKITKRQHQSKAWQWCAEEKERLLALQSKTEIKDHLGEIEHSLKPRSKL